MIAKRVCKDIHDFSLFLEELCRINSEDPSRESRVKTPRYHLGKTGIFGEATDIDIVVWFPKDEFPLSEMDFTRMYRSFQNIGIEVKNCPEEHTGYEVEWVYALEKSGKIVAPLDAACIGSIVPFIKNKKRAYLMLHKNKVDKLRNVSVENILNSIIIDGLYYNYSIFAPNYKQPI